jgi:glycosyltransferase involved in cell wall biosynthesis
MKSSIIIRAKDEGKHLARTLNAVLAQRVEPHEVIVIDSGSGDSTCEIAERFQVKLLRMPPEEWGYSHSLNVGAACATGEILVSLSAHCVPVTVNWLESLLRHFDDAAVAGVWGPGARPGRSLPSPKPPTRQLPGEYGVHNRTWGLSNGNSAVRRSLWRRRRTRRGDWKPWLAGTASCTNPQLSFGTRGTGF